MAVADISEMEVNKVDVQDSESSVGDSILSFLKSFNNYATKKTFGQGVLDVALFSANISKLTAVLDREKKDGVYYTLLVMISISLILQVIVGGLMAAIGRMNLKTEEQRKVATVLNNIITVMTSVICVINLVLSVIDFSAPVTKRIEDKSTTTGN